MKILVLSDSHSSISFMRRCIETINPDAIVHLGDHYDDAQTMSEIFPQIPMYRVPGNCDRFRCPPSAQEILVAPVCGVRLYMTHGHVHQVKLQTGYLISEARKAKVDAVLYGHTHMPDCRYEDGLWILNPGSCGCSGGSAGLIEVSGGKIMNCRVFRRDELEDIK